MWMLAVQSVALLILALSIYVLTKKVTRLEDRSRREEINHAFCISHIAHYVGDAFAEQILRLAAEDFDSVEGQTQLRTIMHNDYKMDGPSGINLWLHARADSLVHEEEEAPV